jgi:hypothetical protein
MLRQRSARKQRPQVQRCCDNEAPENSVLGVVVVVTAVVIIVVAAVIAVVIVVAVARDNGTILIEQNYPKEEEGEPRYFATRIVG